MRTPSHFETLTKRKRLLQETTERLISDLQRLVQMLDAHIEIEEERTGFSDPRNANYADSARQLRARRDNLLATLDRLKAPPPVNNAPPIKSYSRRRR